MGASYNGHRSWNAWNVALWIGNDEGLYRLALDCISRQRTREGAARAMLNDLNEDGIYKTPDGGRYNVSTIKAAMVGLN